MIKNNRNRYIFGVISEWLAAFYLMLKGYHILHMRYKTYAGEIDIIAKRRKNVVMVEVKARKKQSDTYEAICYTQQQRISNAADIFLRHYPRFHQHIIRFDAIYISPWKWPVHIVNAWN